MSKEAANSSGKEEAKVQETKCSRESETADQPKTSKTKTAKTDQTKKKRRPKPRGGYRDVVEVDESETDLNQALDAIISSCPGVLDGTKWINITPPADIPNYRLWVLLATLPRPGHYRFSITGLQVTDVFGLQIILKQIREVHEEEVKQRAMELHAQQGWWGQVQWLNLVPISPVLSSTLTILNIQDKFKLLVVVLVMALVGLGKVLVNLGRGVRELHKMLLLTVNEVGQLIRNVTPLLAIIVSFVEKVIGGLFLLMAMVYRGCQSYPPPRTPLPTPPALRRANTLAVEQHSSGLLMLQDKHSLANEKRTRGTVYLRNRMS